MYSPPDVFRSRGLNKWLRKWPRFGGSVGLLIGRCTAQTPPRSLCPPWPKRPPTFLWALVQTGGQQRLACCPWRFRSNRPANKFQHVSTSPMPHAVRYLFFYHRNRIRNEGSLTSNRSVSRYVTLSPSKRRRLGRCQGLCR